MAVVIKVDQWEGNLLLLKRFSFIINSFLCRLVKGPANAAQTRASCGSGQITFMADTLD